MIFFLVLLILSYHVRKNKGMYGSSWILSVHIHPWIGCTSTWDIGNYHARENHIAYKACWMQHSMQEINLYKKRSKHCWIKWKRHSDYLEAMDFHYGYGILEGKISLISNSVFIWNWVSYVRVLMINGHTMFLLDGLALFTSIDPNPRLY